MNIMQKYTLDTYMPGYTLACVHIHKDTNIFICILHRYMDRQYTCIQTYYRHRHRDSLIHMHRYKCSTHLHMHTYMNIANIYVHSHATHIHRCMHTQT